MQWYQMFEYAIGHWLQKATEHMMGCVLCRYTLTVKEISYIERVTGRLLTSYLRQ